MEPEEFVRMLENLHGRLAAASYRDALDAGARQVGEIVGDNMLRAEDSSGTPWPPHAPLTVQLHGPHPLLRLTWTMYAAATNPDDPNASRTLADREVLFGIDGTAIPYAATHQRGEGRVPQREFFYVRNTDEPRVEVAMIESITEIVERAVEGS
jgi:hypothetical protein